MMKKETYSKLPSGVLLLHSNLFSSYCQKLLLMFLLMLSLGVFGQATLPVNRTAWASAPTGWTDNGVQRTSTFACSGSDGGSLQSTGKSYKVYLDTTPDKLSYSLKGSNPSTGSFKVQESPDGSLWSDVQAFSTINGSTCLPQINIQLLASSRYVQFILLTKTAGNVDIDDVSITKLSSPDPVLAITGTADHGSVCPGTAASSQTYTINNSGSTAAAGVTVISDNAEFAVTGAPTSVAANGSATYSVTFTPSSAGAKSATITVSSTTSGSNVATSAITGTGAASTFGVVTTSAVGTITAKSAVINGNVSNIGSCPVISERGFVYSVTLTNNTPTNAGTGVTTVPVAGVTTGNISTTPNTLLSSTPYSYRAYVFNGSTYTYGTVVNFTTLPALAVSGVLAHGSVCPNVAATSQTNTITNNGNSTVTGITIGSSNPEFAVSGLSAMIIVPGATATYVVTFTPTTSGAKTATITIASSEPSVTSNLTGTGAASVSQVAVTQTPSNISSTSVTLRATNGTTFGTCPNTTEKGFVYAINSVNLSPINGGTGVTKFPIATLGASGAFTQGITGLAEGTTYSYQAYLFDGTTYTYGGVQTFQTTVTAPSGNVTAAQACLTDIGGIISWTAPSTIPTGYMVFAVAAATVGSGSPTTPVADYATVNSDFSAATTYASLGKLLYKGNATSVNITGLTEDAAYSFRIFAYNEGAELRKFADGTAAGAKAENVSAQDDVKTFTATPTNNQVTLNWTYNGPISCFDDVIIVANQGAVVFTPTGDGTQYSVSPSYTGTNQVVYRGSANSKAITALTNGLEYCFKIFVRRGGTSWSDGTSICATPDVAYCPSQGSTTDATGITKVEFGTINQTSTGANAYTDFTSVSTTAALGETIPLTVRVNTAGNWTVYTKAWIDWNHNGSFNDTGEEFDLGNVINQANGITSLSPLDITVPISAYLGNVRMRISAKFSAVSTSCETFSYGEVEDYTINIFQPINAEINVRGAGNSIPSGSDTPFGFNNTQFALTNLASATAPKSFTIENIGLTNLNLTGTPIIKIEGANPADFIVTQQATTPVANGSPVLFSIKFQPTVAGLRTATVSIANDDSDENPYTFAVEGTGNCASAPTINVFPTSGPVNTFVTFSSSTSNLTGATVTYNNVAVPVTYQTAATVEVVVPSNANDGNFIIQLATGCSATQSFDVFDTDITACQTSSGGGSASDLMIYEVYDENGGSGGVVTIYNRTGAVVDLSNYSIYRAPDYNGTYKNIANLTGTIADGSVAIFGVTGSLCTFPAFNGNFGAGFNANDGFRLMKGATLIDDVRAPNYVGYYLKRKNTNLYPQMTFNASFWTTQNISPGQCLAGVGTAPDIKTPPILNSSPQYVINCGITGAILSAGGTEGVSGGPSLAYQWYALGTSGNWTVVTNGGVYSGANSQTLSISDINNLDDYQFYCRILENTATCYIATNSTQIRIAEKTWDGSNWLGRGNSNTIAPTVIDKIKLNAHYNTATNGNLNGCSLFNNSTFQLIIPANSYANIEGNIANNGSMLIESDGNLIQKNDAAIFTGTNITSKRTLTLNTSRNQYNYLISPVEGQILNTIYKDGSGNPVAVPYVLYHNEATNKFYTSTGAYIKGRGLAVKEPAAGFTPTTMRATFVGKPTNGSFAYGIVNSNTGDTNRGYNLIGNPYPSNIDLVKFYTLNGGDAGGKLESTAYFWDNKANDKTSQQGDLYGGQAYGLLNLVSGSGTAGTGGLMTTKKPKQMVKTGQGFMVKSKMNSTTITFNNSIRTSDNVNATDFFGKTSPTMDRYWLNMITPQNIASNIAIVYFPEGNNLFAADDSRTMGGSDAIYSMVETEKLAINGRSSFVNTDIIPLGSNHFVTGTYTIALDEKEGIFANGQAIYLKDNQSGIVTNLSAGNYTFSANAGESTGRFIIIYKPETVLATETFALKEIMVYRDSDRMVIKSPKTILEVQLFDATGRLLHFLKPNAKEAIQDITALASGVYLFKIKTADGGLYTRKFIR